MPDLPTIFSALTSETAAKVAAGAIAGITAFQKLRQRTENPRALIAADLKLLSQLEKDSPGRKLVEAHLEAAIQEEYGSKKSRRFTIYNRNDFYIGLVLLLSSLAWTIYVVRDGFSWWSIASGLIAFVGFSLVVSGLDPEAEKG